MILRTPSTESLHKHIQEHTIEDKMFMKIFIEMKQEKVLKKMVSRTLFLVPSKCDTYVQTFFVDDFL